MNNDRLEFLSDILEDRISMLRREAKSLRADTLTSMAEGICNTRIADEMETIANALERDVALVRRIP